MRIKVIAEDFENAGKYTDPNNCLLATALKRIYGEKADMHVFCFYVGKVRYDIPNRQMEKLDNAYGMVNNRGSHRKPVNKTPFTIYARRERG